MQTKVIFDNMIPAHNRPEIVVEWLETDLKSGLTALHRRELMESLSRCRNIGAKSLKSIVRLGEELEAEFGIEQPPLFGP